MPISPGCSSRSGLADRRAWHGSLFAGSGSPAIGEIVGGFCSADALAAISPAVQHWIFPSAGPSAAALGALYQLGCCC